ncbi:MAG TPA: DMT family transporter [Vicinamibacteria bacterium]
MRPAQDDLPRAALFMVASALLFAAMGAAVKAASLTVPNVVVVFFRNAFGLLVLLPWLWPMGRRGLRTAHLRGHLLRGIAGLLAMYCFFYAIAHMRLADAVLLNYSLPLFMPFVEKAWLGEPVPRGLWPALLLGFLGIVLILRPGAAIVSPAALAGVLAAVFASVAQVGVRRLTQTEPARRIVFYFAAVSTVVSAAPLPLAWRTPTTAAWLALFAAGACATAGQLLLTRAYSHAPAARVGPFIYASVVFAAGFDWLLWRRLPDAFTVGGTLLVVGAGALALRLRERPPLAA